MTNQDAYTRRRKSSFTKSPAGKILFLLCFLYLLLYMDRVNLSVAASAIKTQFHLNAMQLGLAFSAFGYGYALFQVLGGWIGDRIGTRKTLGFFLVFWGCVAIAIGFVNSLATLIVARIALGIAEGTALPNATRAVGIWMPVERRAISQGLMQGCSRFGTAIAAPLIAGIMLLFGTWRAAFWVLGAVGLVWAVIWAWYYRDRPAEHPALRNAPGGVREATKPATATTVDSVPWKPLLRRMAPAIGVWFCQGWTFWMFLSWIPIFLLTQYKVDIKTSALFTAGVFFAGVAGDLVGGLVSDRILRSTGDLAKARRDVVMVAFAGTAIFVAPIIFVRHDVDIVALCLSGALFFLELMTGPMWSVPMDIAPNYAGTAAGMMNTGSAIASILTPLAFGLLVDWTGNWNIPFIGSFAFLVIGCGLATQIRPEQQVQTQSGTVSPEIPAMRAG
jgi:sugar phosphate permease